MEQLGFGTAQRVSDVLRQAFVKNTDSASGSVSGISSIWAYDASEETRGPRHCSVALREEQ